MSNHIDEPRLARMEISKQALKFSIAHFTIFSEHERENLHGHNFQLVCEVAAPVSNNGLLFDYGILKNLLRSLCNEIDEQLVLPTKSPHLSVAEKDDCVIATFDGAAMSFMKRDVTLLPIRNTTVEEFSWYFLNKIRDHHEIVDKGVAELTVKVSSSPGQCGTAFWRRA